MTKKTKLPVDVIVGAAGGIGSELCRMRSEKQCHLVLVGRSEFTLD